MDAASGKVKPDQNSVTDAPNNTTSYTYDALNRLTQAVQKNGAGSQIASYAYGYDPAGNMTSQTMAGRRAAPSVRLRKRPA